MARNAADDLRRRARLTSSRRSTAWRRSTRSPKRCRSSASARSSSQRWRPSAATTCSAPGRGAFGRPRRRTCSTRTPLATCPSAPSPSSGSPSGPSRRPRARTHCCSTTSACASTRPARARFRCGPGARPRAAAVRAHRLRGRERLLLTYPRKGSRREPPSAAVRRSSAQWPRPPSATRCRSRRWTSYPTSSTSGCPGAASARARSTEPQRRASMIGRS